MKIIKRQIESNDIKELERVFYERNVLRSLIAFFVELCDSDGKREMLKDYIEEYKKQLEFDEAHYDMLRGAIVNMYFPEELKTVKDTTDYSIDFNLGEITYYGRKYD